MQKIIFNWYEKYPLAFVCGIALLVRLLAAVGAPGYGMTDDHFNVIEIAQSWINGWNFWLREKEPALHSVVYPGLHYCLFRWLLFLGVDDPEAKMLVVRLIHAMYSVLSVYFSYKITEKLSDKQTAFRVSLCLSLLWFMPFMSVRNLIEMVCLPPILAAFYFLLTAQKGWQYCLSGFVMGLGFPFRYQSALFGLGAGLALWIQKKWLQGVLFGMGYFVAICVTQGFVDYLVWDKPFAAVLAYINYNAQESNYSNYPMTPWYSYLLTLAGLLIPPLSLFWFWGYVRMAKPALLLFIPASLFFVFHSYYPNKQERFILPFVPFLILLGQIGWQNFVSQSIFWQNKKRLLAKFQIFFWGINTILLLVLSTNYSKKTRVEAMRYLSTQPYTDAVIMDHWDTPAVTLPQYYLGHKHWLTVYELPKAKPITQLAEEIKAINNPPLYILLYEEKDLSTRLARLNTLYPRLHFLTRIEPSLVDKVVYTINPVNLNQVCLIYKIEK